MWTQINYIHSQGVQLFASFYLFSHNWHAGINSLIMCADPGDLRRRAGWDGASGTSRRQLLDALHGRFGHAHVWGTSFNHWLCQIIFLLLSWYHNGGFQHFSIKRGCINDNVVFITTYLWIPHLFLYIQIIGVISPISLGLRLRFWKFIKMKFGISNGVMTERTWQARVKINPQSYGVEGSVFFVIPGSWRWN